jgi:hypothetical protein
MEHPRPDTKHWTWVLERPCPACHFDAGTIERHTVGRTLRSIVDAWRDVLSRGDIVRQRPPKRADSEPIWSALEYGCHVRDVFVLAFPVNRRNFGTRSRGRKNIVKNDS